jgi:hypothetical protein
MPESTYCVDVTNAEFSFVYGPEDVAERYILYPATVDVLAVQFNVTEWETG